MVVAIIGTIAGVGLLGFIIARITGLIKAWIERNKGGYDEETFNRLAKAFMQHKKDMEQRMQNLEAIIADEEETTDSTYPQIEEPKGETILNNDLEEKNKKVR